MIQSLKRAMMDYESFEKIILNLFIYFQRKPPSERAIKLWFTKTKSIPLEAAKWTATWITRDFDKLPWNIGKAFLMGWGFYKKQNSSKIISEHKREYCKDCYGEGVIAFKKFSSKQDGIYEYVCRCGSCENWKRHVGPLAMPAIYTLTELKNMDVEIVGRIENSILTEEAACETTYVVGPSGS